MRRRGVLQTLHLPPPFDPLVMLLVSGNGGPHLLPSNLKAQPSKFRQESNAVCSQRSLELGRLPFPPQACAFWVGLAQVSAGLALWVWLGPASCSRAVFQKAVTHVLLVPGMLLFTDDLLYVVLKRTS